eukprot:2291890-Ditylum_brightwellii.AAC.1
MRGRSSYRERHTWRMARVLLKAVCVAVALLCLATVADALLTELGRENFALEASPIPHFAEVH